MEQIFFVNLQTILIGINSIDKCRGTLELAVGTFTSAFYKRASLINLTSMIMIRLTILMSEIDK